MTSDDDGTRPRLFALFDEIRFGETLPLVCCLELLSEIIVAHATGVDDRLWGQHILEKWGMRFKGWEWEGGSATYSCTASSILCGATGYIDHLMFLDDLVITLKE
jgi:hypothetical protein